jgi:hypothetical protein
MIELLEKRNFMVVVVLLLLCVDVDNQNVNQLLRISRYSLSFLVRIWGKRLLAVKNGNPIKQRMMG